MNRADTGTAAPPTTGGDGVRITRQRSGPGRWWPLALVIVVLVAMGWLFQPKPRATTNPTAAGAAPAQTATEVPVATVQPAAPEATATRPPASRSPLPPIPPSTSEAPPEWRTGDANDLATYVSPNDPVPTAAELIQALREAGETGGIAAFNPPGTSPPLRGIAVPEEFPLPEGYVRHYQATDDGQSLEPILMFSPDYVFRDASGREIPIPEDRVVPPEMAPPGLPIREIEIPPPPE